MALCCLQDIQSTVQIATEACGFITIVGGTFLLHATKDMDITVSDLGKLTTKDTPHSSLMLASINKDKRGDENETTPLFHPIDVDGGESTPSAMYAGRGHQMVNKR